MEMCTVWVYRLRFGGFYRKVGCSAPELSLKFCTNLKTTEVAKFTAASWVHRGGKKTQGFVLRQINPGIVMVALTNFLERSC